MQFGNFAILVPMGVNTDQLDHWNSPWFHVKANIVFNYTRYVGYKHPRLKYFNRYKFMNVIYAQFHRVPLGCDGIFAKACVHYSTFMPSVITEVSCKVGLVIYIFALSEVSLRLTHSHARGRVVWC